MREAVFDMKKIMPGSRCLWDFLPLKLSIKRV
jgi:hypothetical protein